VLQVLKFFKNVFWLVKKTCRILQREGITGINARFDNVSTKLPGVLFNETKLHYIINNIYNMPEVKIDESRRVTVNVLVPAFNFESMSAGFFGVFQTALFIKRIGYHVRLVLFDDFNFNYSKAKTALRSYPGLEMLFDELEVSYIGNRVPLKVNPLDTSVATVWYSAYLAEKIQNVCNRDRAFLYLIQDYETRFYSGSSLSMLAEQTYKMHYAALFSTSPLRDYFLAHDIGGINKNKRQSIFFNNACSSNLPSLWHFKDMINQQRKKKLVFYSRPVVNRNMYELGALVLIRAVTTGILPENEWDFYGMGLGDAKLELSKGIFLEQLPRMSLEEYIKSVSGYDLCLSLMASPHPSLVPFDFAGSGCLVVTNNCDNKDQNYFNGISQNIIACEPDLYALLDGIKSAVGRIPDVEARYEAAKNMNYPTTWDRAWTDAHIKFINSILE
jgi:hypothetical protein